MMNEVFEEFAMLHTVGHMGHVREYTPREVIGFLTRCGLRPVQLIYRGSPGGWKEGLFTRFRRSLLPFFSVVAEKPTGTDHHTETGSSTL